MKKALVANIKQALSNRGFLIGMLGVMLVILLSSMQDVLTAFRTGKLLAYGFHNTLISDSLKSNAMVLALPIFCALPYTASFVDDVKSGFIKEYLPRTTTTHYLWGKSLACVVSGGLTLALGIIVSYVLFALVFLPMEASPVPVKGTEPPAYFGQLMGDVLLFFLSGAFWSMVGLAFATLTNSKYMAYTSPFVIYYVLIILYERYFEKFYILYPKEWINPSDAWMFGNMGVVLLLFELTLIMGLCFAAAAKRRLVQI